MKRIVCLIICALGFLSATWVRILGTSDEPVPPNKSVVASDSSFVCIRVETYGFIKEDTVVQGENFQRITIPDEPIEYDTLNIGKPQIPYVRLLIAIPDSADLDIAVSESDYTLFEDYLLYPVPQIVFEETDSGFVYPEEVFFYDSLFYEKDTLYPNKFHEIKSDGHWRDQRVLEVFLYPVQFNPQRQEMYFYAGIDIEIDYLGETVINTHGLGPFEEIGRDILLNYPGIDQELPPPPPCSVRYYVDLKNSNNIADYIIVTHDDFLENEVGGAKIDSFAWWRVDHNNFDVGIVDMLDVYEQFSDSLSNVPIADSAAVLKDFLVYAYDNWSAPHMTDNHFAYCLFIGDWDYVPIDTNTILGVRYMSAYEGYYRDLTSDNLEDIMLGRWPVKMSSPPTDLITITDKTINYEKYPTLGDWRRRGFVIGGPGPYYWSYCDPNIDAAVTYFDDIDYDTFTVRCPDAIAACTMNFHDSVYKYLNWGDIIAAFYGHGTWGAWGNQFEIGDTAPPVLAWFNAGHALTLNNNDSLPVILSYACLTGSFHADHPHFDTITGPNFKCLGDGFLFNPDGGAVAFYGGTSSIYMNYYNPQPMLRTLRYQDWTLGKALVNTTPNTPNNCFCLLGDPALDLGDYTAYPDLPDLVVRPQGIDISLSEPYPYPDDDDSIPVRVQVWNIGGDTAYDVEVDFACIEPATNPYTFDFATISEIPPLDSVTCVGYWTSNAQYGEIGDCEFIISADPTDNIDESWEYNNNSSIVKKVALYPNQPGWPWQIAGCSQPGVANLDRTGGVEVVCSGLDHLYVLNPNGSMCSDWPQDFPGIHGFVLGDIDRDTKIEIIAVSNDSIKVYDWDGAIQWAQEIPNASTYDIKRPPSLGRIANSSSPYLDIVIISTPNIGSPYKVLVYNYAGALVYTFQSDRPVMYNDNSHPVSISDINDDSKREIVVSSSTNGSFTTIFNKDGLVTVLDYGSKMTPALADINNDTIFDLIIGDCSDGKIRVYNAVTDSFLWETQTGGAINSSPAVGNISTFYDGNEIAFGNDAKEIWAIKDEDGLPWDPWELVVNAVVRTSPALANIDNNSGPDIIIGSDDNYVYALKYDAYPIPPFPLPVFGSLSSPVIGDIDGDTKNEMILATSDGYLHVWNALNSSVLAYNLEWPQFHHDYQRTGLYGWVEKVRIKGISAQVFSDETEVSFSVEESCSAQIEVYDSQGELVKSLMNQNLSTGDYEVTWDGTDNYSDSLPNGTYIFEIKTEDEVETIPMVINR